VEIEMNTKNRPGRVGPSSSPACRQPLRRNLQIGASHGGLDLVESPRPALRPAGQENPAAGSDAGMACRHPLSRVSDNERLLVYEQRVRRRLAAIPAVLRQVAAEQNSMDFVERAQSLFREELGIDISESLLTGTWIKGLDMRALYAAAMLATLRSIAEQVHAGGFARHVDPEETAESFFLDCGYHAVDISPCSDGRLKGLVRYILRLPDEAIRYRKAYAGALFDVEANVTRWAEAELSRYREHRPVGPDAASRYLKIAVYHWSSSDPLHMGCAAHASNRRRAAAAALGRLREFREAIQNRYCCGASVDLLLIGVDTDTDAITVHVPDADGELSLHRCIDNMDMYHRTVGDDPSAAYLSVYQAVSATSEQEGWGRGNGQPAEGMRRLVATLLVNNLSQIDYVCATQGGRYRDVGHAEQFISVGDGFEEFQLRNLAYYAHLQTLEEGAPDLDVGVKILEELNVPRGLPVVVAVHFRYDSGVPGSRDRTVARCQRVTKAIQDRYADLCRRGHLVCGMTIQDQIVGSPVEVVRCAEALEGPRACVDDSCDHSGMGSEGRP
jgi:carboxysome shell carbonic anhydrase